MSLSECPGPTGPVFPAQRSGRELSGPCAMAVIGGGSALIWGIIAIAICQFV